MSVACVAGTQNQPRPTRSGVLARVCTGWQRKNHARTAAFASGGTLRSGSPSRCAGLRCGYSSARGAKAIVATRDCSRLSRAFGFLLDELVRRIAGKGLSEYWQENFARPLNLDFWIGLPQKENSRVAMMYAAKSGKTPEPKQFYADLLTPGTLARKTFTSAHGLNAVSAMNTPAIRAQPIVSFGGIGSAA